VQLLHRYSFSQWTGSFNAHLTEGFWATLDETFTDLYYVDDVAFLAELLEVLLALDVLKDEAHPLCLEVNWQKTKIQSTVDLATLPQPVLVSGNPVDVVEFFVYLGSEIHTTGSSEPEVRRRNALAKTCFNQLNRGIWHFSIIIIINEYSEAGLMASIFVQNISGKHELQQELYKYYYYIVTSGAICRLCNYNADPGHNRTHLSVS